MQHFFFLSYLLWSWWWCLFVDDAASNIWFRIGIFFCDDVDDDVNVDTLDIIKCFCDCVLFVVCCFVSTTIDASDAVDISVAVKIDCFCTPIEFVAVKVCFTVGWIGEIEFDSVAHLVVALSLSLTLILLLASSFWFASLDIGLFLALLLRCLLLASLTIVVVAVSIDCCEFTLIGLSLRFKSELFWCVVTSLLTKYLLLNIDCAESFNCCCVSCDAWRFHGADDDDDDCAADFKLICFNGIDSFPMVTLSVRIRMNKKSHKKKKKIVNAKIKTTNEQKSFH